MTDKEIIKALECCFVQRNHSECPLKGSLKGFGSTVVDCRYELAHHVITLITAQKSQIEDLSVALYERLQRIKELEAEVERLQDHNLRMARKHYDDGVREFAKRLKTYFITPAQTKIDTEIVELIETLVKEMTEDTDNGSE